MPEPNDPIERVAIGTLNAPRRSGAKPKRRDMVRLKKWRDKCQTGMDPTQAWLEIITDKTWGLRELRGAPSANPALVERTFRNFLIRVAPEAVEMAHAQSVQLLSATAPNAAARVAALVDPDKVDDPQVARVNLDAAKIVLGAVGVIASGSSKGGTAAVQVNVGSAGPDSGREWATFLEADPVAMGLWRELCARREAWAAMRPPD